MSTNVIEDRRTGWGERDVDLLGIGFGPANLALAALIDELPDGQPPVSSLFLERKGSFAWHPSMLIDGTRIQLSFLKDLVSIRDPQSRYSFLCYLKAQDRLLDFINLREFFPTRIEFNDYYSWVAQQVSDQVLYEREVVAIEPRPGDDGWVERLEVLTRNTHSGQEERYSTRNLVVATGGKPYLPPGIEVKPDGRVFHCKDFLRRVKSVFPRREAPYRMLVVGSGQSAAEIFHYLYSNYPEAEVINTMRRYAFKPADESHFVNEIFNPQMVDFLFGLEDEERKRLIADHYDTNYSAVDLELIKTIYSDLYERKVVGDKRVCIRPFMELTAVEETDDGIVARFCSQVERKELTVKADGMVLATGYGRNQKLPLLGSLDPHLMTDASGSYQVDRNYRLLTDEKMGAQVFLQGFCEDTHGISDTLLSVLPIRAQEIFDSLAPSRVDRPAAVAT